MFLVQASRIPRCLVVVASDGLSAPSTGFPENLQLVGYNPAFMSKLEPCSPHYYSPIEQKLGQRAQGTIQSAC